MERSGELWIQLNWQEFHIPLSCTCTFTRVKHQLHLDVHSIRWIAGIRSNWFGLYLPVTHTLHRISKDILISLPECLSTADPCLNCLYTRAVNFSEKSMPLLRKSSISCQISACEQEPNEVKDRSALQDRCDQRWSGAIQSRGTCRLPSTVWSTHENVRHLPAENRDVSELSCLKKNSTNFKFPQIHNILIWTCIYDVNKDIIYILSIYYLCTHTIFYNHARKLSPKVFFIAHLPLRQVCH